MIPAIVSNEKLQNVVISTGNILNVDSKLGRKSNEELLDSLELTLQCKDSAKDVELNTLEGQVLRATKELNQKLTENERPAISIGAKIFINKTSSAYIEQAIASMLQILDVKHVDNVVLAYHPHPVIANSNSLPSTPTTTDGGSGSGTGGGGGGGMPKWHNYAPECVAELKELWTSLEQFAQRKQITQLGIADLDIDTLRELCDAATIQPTIAQINLSKCCKVPTELQEFCAQHDIQLLTHSDPEILLPDEQFIVPGYTVDWTLRYQVHLRCRGVLTAKGYILGASKEPTIV